MQIGRIREVIFFCANAEPMHLGVERISHLASVPAKFDDCPAWHDMNVGEALRCEPLGDRAQIRIRHSELRAKLLRRQPLVKVRVGFRLLVV